MAEVRGCNSFGKNKFTLTTRKFLVVELGLCPGRPWFKRDFGARCLSPMSLQSKLVQLSIAHCIAYLNSVKVFAKAPSNFERHHKPVFHHEVLSF